MKRLVNISTIPAIAVAAAAFAAPGSARAWVVPGSAAVIFDGINPTCLEITGGAAINDCTVGNPLAVNVPIVVQTTGASTTKAMIRGNGTDPTLCIAVMTFDNVNFLISTAAQRTQTSWLNITMGAGITFQASAANYFHCNLPKKIGVSTAGILFASYT